MQGSLNGTLNAFVTEIMAGASSLGFSTYLGGSGQDGAFGLALDGSENIYITGAATSTDFPTYIPIQSSLNGSQNAFVAKLNAGGGSLAYSTYLGGSGSDNGNGIGVDSNGNAYVVGFTSSTDFPTQFPLQASLAGTNNAFVTGINSAGTAWIYSTYLGGNGTDSGTAIAVDPSGDAFVTGYTNSTNFPTQNAFQSTLTNNLDDIFVTEINPTGSAMVYSTYLGGSSSTYGDQAYGIAVDPSGDAYVTGYTSSSDFPTQNPVQPNMVSGAPVNAFVSEFGPGGTALLFSTFLGGSGGEQGYAIAVDGTNDCYVTGYTYSTDFPTTTNPLQPANAGVPDAFIFEISQPSPTPTPTPTDTATNTLTGTPTNTPTITNTPTNSATTTSSFTPTYTATGTMTGTPTNSSTLTVTPTITNTPTNSGTATLTSTPTNTGTNSSTYTPSGTPTLTDSPTITNTPTNSATLTSSSTATNTATNTMTGTPTSTATTTFTFTDSFTPTQTPTSTYSSTPTSTFTNTATPTKTWTSTYTFTGTPTSTFTNTFTYTFTPTITYTPTSTPTETLSPTMTPPLYSIPVIYPNPADGTVPVRLRPPAFFGVSDVKVQIFTLAYRKVQETFYPRITSGTDCLLPLVDKWGKPLADGLYYVVVHTSQGRTIGKLLVLR